MLWSVAALAADAKTRLSLLMLLEPPTGCGIEQVQMLGWQADVAFGEGEQGWAGGRSHGEVGVIGQMAVDEGFGAERFDEIDGER